MHLWPSERIRDSFKIAYLKKLEWNLHRMKIEKETRSSEEKLLLEKEASTSKNHCVPLAICREILLVLSCCYCCFCCGACVGEEDN